MTVKEAFKKHKEIKIDYFFYSQCRICKKWFETLDEEYSFEGDREYFLGDWKREYGVIDLDDNIELIEGNHYKFTKDDTQEDICPKCEAIETLSRDTSNYRLDEAQELCDNLGEDPYKFIQADEDMLDEFREMDLDCSPDRMSAIEFVWHNYWDEFIEYLQNKYDLF